MPNIWNFKMSDGLFGEYNTLFRVIKDENNVFQLSVKRTVNVSY